MLKASQLTSQSLHTLPDIASSWSRLAVSQGHGMNATLRPSTNRHEDHAAIDLLTERTIEVLQQAHHSSNRSRAIAHSIAAISSGAAKARVSCSELFSVLADVATKRATDFRPQALTTMAWSLATVGHDAPATFDAIAASTAAKLDELRRPHLSVLAWSFALADHPSALFDSRFVDKCNGISWRRDDQPDLTRLHQWQLWHEERGVEKPLAPGLAARCLSAMSSTRVQTSWMQTDVGHALREIGMEPEAEVRTPEGYRLDFVIHVDGERVGIEVDGPNHFVANTILSTASTHLKHRQLCRLSSLRTLIIPYFRWNETGHTLGRKRRYLKLLVQSFRDGSAEASGVAVDALSRRPRTLSRTEREALRAGRRDATSETTILGKKAHPPCHPSRVLCNS